MALYDKRIEAIQEADLEALISAAVPEGKSIEYKLTLPGSTDSEKKEFLADISSLANTSGGDVVYGLREDRGIAAELVGISSSNLDQEKLRLEEIIRNGIESRIPNLRIHAIPLASGRITLLIRVPKSYLGPHMVSFKGGSRFYARNSAGKYQLDLTELRTAFGASDSFADNAREFRVERISKILAEDAPVALKDPPILILHLIPVSAFDINSRRDVSSLAGQSDVLRPFQSYSSYTAPRYNFDGLISHDTSQGKAESYVQLFRAGGIIEAVLADLKDERDVNRKFLQIRWLEDRLIEGVPLYLRAQQAIGVGEPVYMLLSLLGVKGFILGVDNWYRVDQTPIDRDVMLIPEVLVENTCENSESLLRPVLDTIWNAAGWARSAHYDKDGNRLRQR